MRYSLIYANRVATLKFIVNYPINIKIMKNKIGTSVLIFSTTVFILTIGLNLQSFSAKHDVSITAIDGPLQYHWADNQLCGDGRTYERCQMDADGDKCDTYNATKPDPPCPDQKW